MIEIGVELARKIKNLLQSYFGPVMMEFDIDKWDSEEIIYFKNHDDITGYIENKDQLIIKITSNESDNIDDIEIIQQANEDLYKIIKETRSPND